MNRRADRSSAARVLGSLVLLAAPAARAEDWRVPEAPIRFTLRLAGEPSHPEAGYLVHLPDGGLLPARYPVTRVVRPDGTTVESYSLWHSPEKGLWIVFADPGRIGEVDVYVGRAAQLRTWTPDTGLRPSPLLAADPATASLAAARRLADLGGVGPTVHVRPKAGIPRAPLSVGGDDSGRPRPTSFYLQAYLDATDPGRTWFAPFVPEGRSEVLIDGNELKPRKRSDRWGGTGAWFDLDRGLHRVEVFTASTPSGRYTEGGFAGHMYLAWQTPNMPPAELGGNGSGPAWEARVIRDREIVRSGRCQLRTATARDGGPVACFTVRPTLNFWFDGEDQLAVYAFDALRAGNPDDTVYQWSLEAGSRADGPSITWLMPGLREHRVSLTARSGGRTSSCTVPVFAYSTAATSLANPHHRLDFRLAMQTMLAAYPAQPDPCAQWGDAYWNNLMRTIEYGKGYPLLRNLFGRHQATAARHLAPDDLRRLEDIFLDVAPRVDPAEALKWIAAFRQGAPTAGRRARLDIREAEVYLIYLDQPRQAAEKLAAVARQNLDEADLAKIRLGDIYFQQGDLNAATRFYADVQQRARRQRNTAPAPGQPEIGSWKVGAVQEASISTGVAHLIDQGEHLLARQALDQWERTFPLGKINEDFVLQEARLYMAITDWKRARWLLEPYCRYVDAASSLPDAAVALMRCLRALDAPPDTLRETAAMLRERLKFHPAAEDLEPYLRME